MPCLPWAQSGSVRSDGNGGMESGEPAVLFDGTAAPGPAPAAPILRVISTHATAASPFSIPILSADFHVGRVPIFVENELARLYGHLYSSLPFIRLFRPMQDVSTYVSRKDDRVVAVLLYRKRRGCVTVLNEYCTLDQAALQRFTTDVFDTFADVDVVRLHHLDTDLRALAMPFQRHACSEDYVLALPATVDAYTGLLGKSTRRNIKRYSAKLLDDHPSFTLRFHAGAEIDIRQLRMLLRMSEAKIRSKGRCFAVDADFAERMLILATQCGFVAVATIDGKLCAGLICFRNGAHYVAKVVAHDSAFDDYWLGTLCYYRTICEAIRRGGSVFNLGMQRYDYKTRLLGIRRDLDSVAIYRSRQAQLRRIDHVLDMANDDLLRRVKLHLLARQGSVLTHSAMQVVKGWRWLRSR